MRVLTPALAILVCLPAVLQSRADPKIISIHPFSAQKGTTFVAAVRGNGLGGAIAVEKGEAPFLVSIEGSDSAAANTEAGKGKAASDVVTLRVTVPEEAKPGRYPIRLITRNGVSNALPVRVVEDAVTLEPEGSHETQDSALAIAAVPAVFAGRLSHRGEVDFYKFDAEAGQTMTFQVISGLPQIASGGSAATVANFDPALSIYEAEGSWFDPKRLKRIAYNDEPVWVSGRSTDAHLVHRFPRAGAYLLRVEAFAGQGGPDYSYELKVVAGSLPEDPAAVSNEWTEHSWSRKLTSNRLNELSVRGGKPEGRPSIETYRASPEGSEFKVPATLQGALTQPGEAHRARFHLDKPADLAIEIETPAAAPPFFNPIVRLLNGSGEEVATNVFAGRGACSGALTKAAQSKTIVPLRDTGDYVVEIRDATADLASPEFQYRVQIRPQAPHVGQIRIESDAVNLAPGEAKTIRVVFDREEDYRGAITVLAESLPPGISASSGADFEPDTDPPPTTGKRERYVPRTERAVVVLSASEDAAPTPGPRVIRLVARPVIDGKLGPILATKSIYAMVIEKP